MNISMEEKLLRMIQLVHVVYVSMCKSWCNCLIWELCFYPFLGLLMLWLCSARYIELLVRLDNVVLRILRLNKCKLISLLLAL